jgi:hypothetical protein
LGSSNLDASIGNSGHPREPDAATGNAHPGERGASPVSMWMRRRSMRIMAVGQDGFLAETRRHTPGSCPKTIRSVEESPGPDQPGRCL